MQDDIFQGTFQDPKALKRDQREIIQERAARTREISRQEAREGVTISSEDNINFFER
ncbi:MAG: hypothetical protein A4E70_00969 [Syntrophus sp. PtaU1.Bin005]|jgi:hypothetical protein|nr:MAG: hypothetical protein A4E69_02679 [Syntrophus sp. PtaB.Bin138]OPY81993.1 MAG: hypothetical protein A4E70_00969 [Syntrophus sp. PtaU1.Bin005]